MQGPFFCYIVECCDGTFYTGWAKDPQKRLLQHNAGKGAKYTRMHSPVRLVYTEPQVDLSTALKRERAIKKYSHEQKLKLIQGSNL